MSRSRDLSVEALGLEDGESVEVMMGRRYGTRGMYARVCRARWTSERRMVRWKGKERELEMSLI